SSGSSVSGSFGFGGSSATFGFGGSAGLGEALTGFDVLNGSGASKSASTAESCIRCRALDIGVSEAVGAGALGVVGLAGASGAVAISAIIISLSQLAVVIIES